MFLFSIFSCCLLCIDFYFQLSAVLMTYIFRLSHFLWPSNIALLYRCVSHLCSGPITHSPHFRPMTFDPVRMIAFFCFCLSSFYFGTGDSGSIILTVESLYALAVHLGEWPHNRSRCSCILIWNCGFCLSGSISLHFRNYCFCGKDRLSQERWETE